jgi:kinesin family protein 6/9
MLGDTANFAHRGIIPRAMAQVFAEIQSRPETSFNISMTYMEVYNEKIFDLLLDPADTDRGRVEYKVAEDSGGRGVYVRGLREVRIADETEALSLLYAGELLRTTATHNLNRRSNRSHCIVTIYLTQQARSGVSEKVARSKLHLVDLAGSERLKKALDLERLQGRALSDETIKKESMHINQSLSYLEQCVVALSRKNPGHIPYRQTKLTNVLKDALGGNCNTLLFACIYGEETHAEETLSTLRLATRMMRVQNETRATESLDPAQLLRKQERTIRELKQELLMHDALVERGGVAYDPYTPSQLEALRERLAAFLEAQGPDEEDATLPHFESVRQMREVCRILKGMVRDAIDEASRVKLQAAADICEASANAHGGGSISAPRATSRQNSRSSQQQFVGDLQGGGGFALGHAPDGAAPRERVIAGTSVPAESRTEPRGVTQGSAVDSTVQSSAAKQRLGNEHSHEFHDKIESIPAPYSEGNSYDDEVEAGFVAEDMDENERAFNAFKASTEGFSLNRELLEEKKYLRSCKTRVRATIKSVNSAKAAIDRVEEELEQLRKDGDRDGEVACILKVKEARRAYKHTYENLCRLKEDVQEAEQSVDSRRRDLLRCFDEWKLSHTGPRYGIMNSSRMPRAVQLNTGGSRHETDEREEEKVDQNELFEQMEIDRVNQSDPKALAFFRAQKARVATQHQNHLEIRLQRASKRAQTK